MNWTNLHLHSNYSHDCISPIKDIVKFIKKDGQTAVAITDHGTMSGTVELFTECKKQGIMPIAGQEFYITKKDKPADLKDATNKSLNHLVVLAKNYKGYRNLLRLTTLANMPEHFYYRPRIDFDMLKNHSEGLIVINGHIGTSIADSLFFNFDAMRSCDTQDEAMEYLDPDYQDNFLTEVRKFQEVFGDDFYCEVQLFDKQDILQQALGTTIYILARKYGFNYVGTGDAHYIEAKDKIFHKTFVCISQNRKIKDAEFSRYLDSGMYGVLTNDWVAATYPEDLQKSTQAVVDKIESYDITRPHSIPNYPVKDKNQYLRDLAYKNYGTKCPDEPKYKERLEYELDVITGADLAGYFLIVQDYMKWAKNHGMLCGPSRGSAGGCLLSYLLDITEIDPIEYDLMFDRFLNPARISQGVLPDIDSDFPASRRDEVIEYIRDKYGRENVAAVVTFNSLQGKGALRDVLRIHSVCDFTTIGKICDSIPGRDTISDKISEFKEETGMTTVLEYIIHKEPDLVKDYVHVEDGEIHGELAEYFKIAIGLEGSIKTESKHACAILISDEPIVHNAPLIRDKNSDELMCSYDMNSFPKVGLEKFDILGLKDLDCLMEVNNLLREVPIYD